MTDTLRGPAAFLVPFLVGMPNLIGVTTDPLLAGMMIVALLLLPLSLFALDARCTGCPRCHEGVKHVHR